ncbi:deoxyguanosinetriphosphate triphosphohydrolase [bacterium]|nr:MAG: deoxyguanosinetriphosphate triphosphohydrolase [bacterium]
MQSNGTLTQPYEHLNDVRLWLEQREEETLCEKAGRSSQSQGRERPEPLDPIRTEWQRDRDRILHSKAFRRLKHKTQVFISPEFDHYRTRLTHTLEVTQVARTVARALRLNEDLVEAIGMGHDVGHSPYGHAGEEALDKTYRRFDPTARFRHYEHSLRIVDQLENHGKGLNLTWEVRDGILHHSKGKADLQAGQSLDLWLKRGKPATLEGQIIRICDRVAYVNHDIDDAVRAGVITNEDLPREYLEVLGGRHATRITTMVSAIIEASSQVVNGRREALDRIAMRDDVMHATDALKNWMFDQVYLPNSAEEEPKVNHVVSNLFEYYMNNPEKMTGTVCPADSWGEVDQAGRARCVCDFVAGMTDRYASQTFADLFLPSSRKSGVIPV